MEEESQTITGRKITELGKEPKVYAHVGNSWVSTGKPREIQVSLC
jgi:hypothetical protein